MKTALITGAGRGLGAGFVDVLSARGYTVYAGVRSMEGKASGERVRYVPLDVADDQSIARVVQQIRQEQGSLELIINNAGLNKDSATGGHPEQVSRLTSLERQKLLRMFEINTVGPLMVAREALPIMTSLGSFIVNISSDRASFGDATNTTGNYGYRASKAALNMITRCLLFDLPANVSTFAVHPGGVMTDMNQHGSLTPEEAAASITGILDNWQPELNGTYVNNDGTPHEL